MVQPCRPGPTCAAAPTRREAGPTTGAPAMPISTENGRRRPAAARDRPRRRLGGPHKCGREHGRGRAGRENIPFFGRRCHTHWLAGCRAWAPVSGRCGAATAGGGAHGGIRVAGRAGRNRCGDGVCVGIAIDLNFKTPARAKLARRTGRNADTARLTAGFTTGWLNETGQGLTIGWTDEIRGPNGRLPAGAGLTKTE